MKKKKILILAAIVGIFSVVAIAADHIDAPATRANSATDITDFYAFEAENSNNVVFVANTQGLLAPGATANTSFDDDVLIEFNIDTTGDNIEDLVIQAIPRGGIMYFFGPYAPSQTGLNSTIDTSSATGQVAISTYGATPAISSSNGMRFFAGPRDDPFFMDFARFTQIVTPGDDDGDGMEEGAFLPAGTGAGFASDTFAGTNVLSVVVEVPKSMVGGSGTINTWVETKTK